MSGYTFSHQFYQRWIKAPDSVRSAIVQELKDIMTLLTTDTAVADFAFTQPNLDDYLDTLYIQDHQEKQAAADQQKAEQEKERLKQEILDKQRVNRERLEKERLEKERLEEEQLAQKHAEQEQADALESRQLEKDSLEKDQLTKLQANEGHSPTTETAKVADAKLDSQKVASQQGEAQKDDAQQTASSSQSKPAILTILHNHASKPNETQQDDTPKQSAQAEGTGANAETEDKVHISHSTVHNTETSTETKHIAIDDQAKSREPIAPMVMEDPSDIDASPSAKAFSSEQEAFVRELETHIDDYLSEQMTQLSETLKAWLRDEVRLHIDQIK